MLVLYGEQRLPSKFEFHLRQFDHLLLIVFIVHLPLNSVGHVLYNVELPIRFLFFTCNSVGRRRLVIFEKCRGIKNRDMLTCLFERWRYFGSGNHSPVLLLALIIGRSVDCLLVICSGVQWRVIASVIVVVSRHMQKLQLF